MLDSKAKQEKKAAGLKSGSAEPMPADDYDSK
jgi:hypothetical protein